MFARIVDTIARHKMFTPGMKVGLAVSGGADSVFLLHALAELAPRWDLCLSILHVDHQLRGEESRGDAAFVARLAHGFELPFYLETADPARAPGNLEEAARESRLAFFRRFLESGELDRVALGHTRNDQAETVLFRFLRGAGTAGLAGIRPVTGDGIVRPLLGLERWEIEGWLRARGLDWREDSTNGTREFARNRIRHDLIPQLAREWNPELTVMLSQTALWAQDEEAYWEAEVDRLASAHLRVRADALLLGTGPVLALPRAAARRLLRRAIECAKGDLRSIGFSHISAILEIAKAADGHGRMQIPGVDVIRSFDWLRFAVPGRAEARDYCRALPVPGDCDLPDGSRIRVEVIEKQVQTRTSDSVYNSRMVGLDWSRLSGALEVRNWQPGDQYQPLGHSAVTKIKSLFQESRVPLWERRHWPVVTQDGAIVWSGSFGPAAAVAAGPQTDAVLLIEHTPVSEESWNRDRWGRRL